MNVALVPLSWEMPHRFKIRESVLRRAPFAGRDVDWQVSLVKVPASKWPILWLRPLDAECDAGFTAFDDYSDQTMFFPQRAKLSSLSGAIDGIFENGNIARQYFLNEAGELRAEGEKAHESVAVGANGIAAWNLAFVRKEIFIPAPFKWSKRLAPADFGRLSARDVWERVQQLLENPKGEVAFAREFAFLGDEEREARVHRTKRGDIGALRNLLHDLLLASSLWNERPTTTQIYLTLSSAAEMEIWDDVSFDQIEAPPALREAIAQLWRYFKPFERRIARFRCVHYFYSNELRIQASRPSAHERLEANWRWRDFEQSR